jgi:imidazolonepropionase-like amidohydrolase
VVDARGKFVVPGLADMHNHVRSGSFRQAQNARTNLTVLLAYGVTTVFNPSSSTIDLADLKAAASDAAPLPRFFGTGPPVTVTGDVLGASVGSPTPKTASDARAAVKSLQAAGADAIKVALDDASWASKTRMPVMTAEVLAAVVDEAHREGLKAFAHAPLLAHAKSALRAGADGLLHGVIDQPIDQELIDLLRRARAGRYSAPI